MIYSRRLKSCSNNNSFRVNLLNGEVEVRVINKTIEINQITALEMQIEMKDCLGGGSDE